MRSIALVLAIGCTADLPDPDVEPKPELEDTVLSTPGLPGWGAEPLDSDSDTDGDTDTDTDTGGDTDTDTDTDPVELPDADGTLTWTTWKDGVQTCTATLSLTGDHGSGCSTCDVVLDVSTAVVSTEGDCDLKQAELFADGRLGYSPRWRDPWRDQLFRGVLMSQLESGDWVVIDRDGDPRGTTAHGKTQLQWTVDRTWGALDSLPTEYLTCGSPVGKRAATPVSGPWTQTDDVPCDGSSVDAWTVSLDQAATFSVDTTDPSRPFDPYLWVNDGDGCTVYESDDAAECTHPPPSFGCPSLTLPAGTWTVYVGSRGQCVTGAAPYRVAVDGADPSLSLSADDSATGGVMVHRVLMDGAITLR